jgi:beta-xylosidase
MRLLLTLSGWIEERVLASTSGDDFNAIDPNILVDTDLTVWLTYGSYWSGIKQAKIDPLTGKLSDTDRQIYTLASRPQSVRKVIEGASIVHHGDYYYLFLSTGFCCKANYLDDDYEQILGRSHSAHGPFVDMSGDDLRGRVARWCFGQMKIGMRRAEAAPTSTMPLAIARLFSTQRGWMKPEPLTFG